MGNTRVGFLAIGVVILSARKAPLRNVTSPLSRAINPMRFPPSCRRLLGTVRPGTIGEGRQGGKRGTAMPLARFPSPTQTRVFPGWAIYDWSKSETSDLDVGEGGSLGARASNEPGERGRRRWGW